MYNLPNVLFFLRHWYVGRLNQRLVFPNKCCLIYWQQLVINIKTTDRPDKRATEILSGATDREKIKQQTIATTSSCAVNASADTEGNNKVLRFCLEAVCG